MKKNIYLLAGFIATTTVLPAMAASHTLQVKASLINAPCSVNVPAVINIGDIQSINQSGGVATLDLNSKTEAGSINCTAPMRPKLQLSNSVSETSTAVHFQSSKSNENVQGTMSVKLDGEYVDFADASCNRIGNGCTPKSSPDAKNSWPMEIITTMKHLGGKDVTPGDVSFSTTMSVNYD